MQDAEVKLSKAKELESTNELTVNEDALSSTLEEEGLVSFHTDLPISLQSAMTTFIEKYPNWDQYRLVQAALAGFLVQKGFDERPITRLYIGNMFGSENFLKSE